MCARIVRVFAMFSCFRDKSYFECALAHGIVSIRRRGDGVRICQMYRRNCLWALAHGIVSIRRRGDGVADLSDVPPELPVGACPS